MTCDRLIKHSIFIIWRILTPHFEASHKQFEFLLHSPKVSGDPNTSCWSPCYPSSIIPEIKKYQRRNVEILEPHNLAASWGPKTSDWSPGQPASDWWRRMRENPTFHPLTEMSEYLDSPSWPRASTHKYPHFRISTIHSTTEFVQALLFWNWRDYNMSLLIVHSHYNEMPSRILPQKVDH